MTKSKTQIEKRLKKKLNEDLIKTIIAAKKESAWVPIASMLSAPRRKKIKLNLYEIDKKSKEGETIVVPGKVLSQGDINKKIRLIAFSFSEMAKQKLEKLGIQFSTIDEEIKRNPKAKDIRILTGLNEQE
ncbi:MAG: 50S ribosomal protein L18e [Candidatus Pacearchaeota archaeon]